MTISKLTQCVLPALAMVVFNGASAAETGETDIVPARVQSDAQISVWVDDASLEVFISQLAAITGREATIEGELQGQVSGRFNGSMVDTLSAISEQYPVIFDMDADNLGIVPETSRSTVTVALSDSVLDQELRQSLMADMLPGNEIELSDDSVVVSGHPSFVSRIAQTLTSAIATAAQADTESSAESSAEVIDVAADVMLDEEIADSEPASRTETAYTPKPIRWVTDIPGFDTF